MKNLLLLLVIVTLSSFMPVAGFITIENSPILAAILAGVYEIASRLIPTVKDYTILGKVLKGLLWLSQFLNVKK
jgi:hypothetical protein